jgi:uncharacterized membrane protein
VALLKSLSTAQKIGLASAAIFYVVAGSLHFIKPDEYLRIVPPSNPWDVAIARLSGDLKSLVVWDYLSLGSAGRQRGDWSHC